MLIKKSTARSVIVGIGLLGVSMGGLLVGANTAAADSIKHESYQRASQSEACTAQAGETAWQASWGAGESGLAYCNPTGAPGTNSGIGAGKNNTRNMTLGCISPAATAALAYAGTDNSAGEWFIPSVSELNAMCLYAGNPSQPVDLNTECTGGQDAAFGSGAFGFASAGYWSSQSRNFSTAIYGNIVTGALYPFTSKTTALSVRPIRSF